MIIIAGIIIELASIVGTIVISTNAGVDSVLEISKNGYKIDKKVLEEFKKNKEEGNLKNLSFKTKVKGTALLLIPGVNVIDSLIKGKKLKNTIMDSPEIKEAIIPMTEREKELYANMNSKFEKLAFTAFTAGKENDEEEFMGIYGHIPIVVDHGLSSLHYEELLPLAYTFDEVKRLNDASGYSYRIGKMDGRNVAIIGIPNADKTICRLQLKNENYKVTHNYENMSEEEAKDKTFIVYPFTKNDAVEETIQEILKSRGEKSKKEEPRLETYSAAPGVEIGYVVSEEDEISIEDMEKVMEESIFENNSQPKERKLTMNPQNK